MSWSAGARGPLGGDLTPEQKQAFKDAGIETWLGSSSYAIVLRDATGYETWDEFGWPPAKVAKAAKEAHWPEPRWTCDKCGAEHGEADEEKLRYVRPARLFLKTCAKLGLSIGFSF